MPRKKSNSSVIELPEVLEDTTVSTQPSLEPEQNQIRLNVVHLVGNVGADPEIRFFESGSVKVSLSLAVRRPSKNSPPDWFTIELWGKTAEIAGNYVKKGSQIGITGYLKIETWSDCYTGERRSRPIIKADSLYLLGNKHQQEEKTYE